MEQAERLLDANPGMSTGALCLHLMESDAKFFGKGGNIRDALYNINQAIEREKALLGPDNFELTTTYYRKGMTLLAGKNYPAAAQAFREALRIAEAYGDEYLVPRAMNIDALGDVLLEQKKLRPALEKYRQALTLFHQSEIKWRSVPIYNNLAVIWRELGDMDSCMYMHQFAWQQVLPELPFQEKAG